MRAELHAARALLHNGALWTSLGANTPALRSRLWAWLRTPDGRQWALEQGAPERAADVRRFQRTEEAACR